MPFMDFLRIPAYALQILRLLPILLMKTKHVALLLFGLAVFLQALGMYSRRPHVTLLSKIPEVTTWSDNQGNSWAWYSCQMTEDGITSQWFSARADGMCYAEDARK